MVFHPILDILCTGARSFVFQVWDIKWEQIYELYNAILILYDHEEFGRDNHGANTRQKVADRLYAKYQI